MLDAELYGGRRAFLEHIRARALSALGVYRGARDIQWAAVQRLTFVCKGNICRSPYACARARSLGVPAVSFGLETSGGQPADPSASKNALIRGIDLSAHRSARIDSPRIAAGDLIIVFEPAQLVEVRRRIGDGVVVNLLGIWSRPSRPYIHDPYGLSDRYFQQCFSVIDANITEIVARMKSNGAPAASRRSTEITREIAAL